MDFIKRIARTIAPQPITLRMAPAEEHIRLDFWRADTVLNYRMLIEDPDWQETASADTGVSRKP